MTLTQISTAGVKDDAVTAGKIPANAVGSSELADNAVTLAKLEHGTSSNDGKFLRANNGADPTFESVITDLVNDTSPQLGGNLASNGNRVVMADDDQITLGTGNDLSLFHESSSNFNVIRQNNALSTKWLAGSDTVARFMTNGAVELYYDNSKKFETTSSGIELTGNIQIPDGNEVKLGAGGDLRMFHANGNANFIQSYNDNNLRIHTFGTSAQVRLQTNESQNNVICSPNAGVELYYNNVKKFETTSYGTLFSSDYINLNGNGYIRLDSTGHLRLQMGTNGTMFTNSSNLALINIDTNGHFIPQTNNAHDLGTSSLRWRNIYTNDLHLSNVGHSNDVDGSWGDWTIQEGESDLFLKNNRSGKKYKFNLTEVS